jgi:hypothetical protein
MPRRPSYCAKLPAAIHELRSLPTDWIDRRQLEEALGVSKTVAWRLLRLCGVEPGPGGALAAPRDELIARLEQLSGGEGPIAMEIRRHDRVDELLRRIRPSVVANMTRVADGDRALRLVNTRFQRLPSNVALSQHSLHIEFSGTADFLEALGAVIYALNNDFEAIEGFIEAGGGTRPLPI